MVTRPRVGRKADARRLTTGAQAASLPYEFRSEKVCRNGCDIVTISGSRGLAYAYSGQHERAIEDYTREMEMAPRVAANPYNNRGWAYVVLGQPEKGLPDLTTAIGMSPDYQRAYENRAKAYIALKDWPSAIADLTAAIQINATAWDYEQRAAAKRATNDEPGAAEDSCKAKALNAPATQTPAEP